MNFKRESVETLLEDFPSGGYTPIPQDLIDWIAPILSEAELRLLLYICRRTWGFGKPADEISLDQLCEGVTSRQGFALDLGTGLSRQGVLNAARGLERKELLDVCRGRGRSQANIYEVLLSADAIARIRKLKLARREWVKSVDPLTETRSSSSARRDSGKGQQRAAKKVNLDLQNASQKVNAVDSQEKAVLQKQDSRYIGAGVQKTHPSAKKIEQGKPEDGQPMKGNSRTNGSRERTKTLRYDPGENFNQEEQNYWGDSRLEAEGFHYDSCSEFNQEGHRDNDDPGDKDL